MNVTIENAPWVILALALGSSVVIYGIGRVLQWLDRHKAKEEESGKHKHA